MIAKVVHKAITCFVRLRAHFSSKVPIIKGNDPSAALEWLEWWSWRATIIIILGIALEGWEAIHFRLPGESGIDVWVKVTADALVGFGLAIEAICIPWAIVVTRREKLESDEKVAAADQRAEEANKAALQAQLELERLRSPRSLNAEQLAAIVEAIDGTEGAEFVGVVSSPDPEIMTTLWVVADALRHAGWKQVGYPPSYPGVEMPPPLGPRIGTGASATDVVVRPGLKPNGVFASADMDVAEKVAEALSANGIKATAGIIVNLWGMIIPAMDAFQIIVGRKT